MKADYLQERRINIQEEKRWGGSTSERVKVTSVETESGRIWNRKGKSSTWLDI